MKKIDYQELISSANMFFADTNLSEAYQEIIDDKICNLRNEMQHINTKAGLIDYIKNNPEALDNIILLLNVSSETFKRIISMFRIQHGQSFTTEWTLTTTRNYIREQKWLRDKVCDLFLNGAEDHELAKVIPAYTLSSFKIDRSTMARLENKDTMQILTKKSLDAGFSSNVGAENMKRVEDVIKKDCKKLRLSYIKNHKIRMRSNTKIVLPFIIKDTETRKGQTIDIMKAFVMCNFCVTTGSGQTTFKNNLKRLKEYRDYNARNATIIAIVDGAGWVARQSDLSDVHDYADYCLNFSHLSDMYNILEETI